MGKKKVYLKETWHLGSFPRTELIIFEGDIKKDKKYLKKYHNSKARYFELKEIK